MKSIFILVSLLTLPCFADLASSEQTGTIQINGSFEIPPGKNSAALSENCSIQFDQSFPGGLAMTGPVVLFTKVARHLQGNFYIFDNSNYVGFSLPAPVLGSDTPHASHVICDFNNGALMSVEDLQSRVEMIREENENGQIP